MMRLVKPLLYRSGWTEVSVSPSLLLCSSDYKDAKIQLLDLPGIIEGAAKGKGRGRQVIGVARTSDLVIMMLDAGKAEIQKELLTMELDAVGIRHKFNKNRDSK
jgi:ribosome-interacting GTPase 1